MGSKLRGKTFITLVGLLGLIASAHGQQGPTLTNLNVPASVISGGINLGTVQLSGPAPSGGISVVLSTADVTTLTVPGNVPVQANRETGQFPIRCGNVDGPRTATITATYQNVSKTASVSVVPASLTTFGGPTQVSSGQTSMAFVRLNGTAGPSGARITLSADNTAVTLPSSVQIAPGGTAVSFSYQTAAMDQNLTVNLTATYKGVSQTLQINIVTAALQRIALSSTTITGGGIEHGTVSLSGAAPTGGINVVLGTNTGAVSIPTAVLVPAGASNADFILKTTGVDNPLSATITGTYNGISKTQDLTINPAVLTRLGFQTTQMAGGHSLHGFVALNGWAGREGATVSLQSNNPQAMQVPAAVTIISNSASMEFLAQTYGVNFNTDVVITATYNGASRTANMTLFPASLTNIATNVASIAGGNRIVFRLFLDGVAAVGGADVTLTSSDPNTLAVPSDFMIPINEPGGSFSAATFKVTANTIVTITATYRGISKTVAVTVTP